MDTKCRVKPFHTMLHQCLFPFHTTLLTTDTFPYIIAFHGHPSKMFLYPLLIRVLWKMNRDILCAIVSSSVIFFGTTLPINPFFTKHTRYVFCFVFVFFLVGGGRHSLTKSSPFFSSSRFHSPHTHTPFCRDPDHDVREEDGETLSLFSPTWFTHTHTHSLTFTLTHTSKIMRQKWSKQLFQLCERSIIFLPPMWRLATNDSGWPTDVFIVISLFPLFLLTSFFPHPVSVLVTYTSFSFFSLSLSLSTHFSLFSLTFTHVFF